jgi:4-hydroxy-tetrahydrodipicolinate reductase
MRIGVAGIAGRMGRLVAEEILAAGATLSGGLALPGDAAPPGIPLFTSLAPLAALSDAIIDFTHASAVQTHAAAIATARRGGHRVAWVLGTTGLSPADQAAIHQTATIAAIIQAANFSPGVTLVLALAERLGAALPAESYDADILEMHHRQKTDAPSGTALAMGAALATGRGTTLAATRLPPNTGQTGPRPPGGIGFASLRGGQITGEHSLVLTAADEQIVLTHKAFDRRSFARGAVRAALWSAGIPPGLYGMTDVLGMETSP